MKNKLQSVYAVLLAACVASCGGQGKKVEEVTLIPVKSGNEYQFINQDGKIVINPQFSQSGVFRDGLALVRSSGDNPMWGFISEDGKYVIPANYKEATGFSEGLAWVISENGAPTAINKKGEVKITLQDAQHVKTFSEGLAAFSVVDSVGQKWGFVNKEGKIVINPQFAETKSFSGGKCAVENNDGKWGYIDKEGKIVINHQFDRAKEFIDGKAVVISGNKAGVIDADGKYIINPQFSSMLHDNELFMVEQDGKWGWCDKEGKITINPQFAEAFPFGNNELAAVKSGKSYGYIDKAGKIVINPQFDFAMPFNGKLALINSSSKVGFIDKEGKYAINPQFDGVSRDLIAYMLDGSSEYESVETDYFNVGGIVNAINLETPQGQAVNSPISRLLSKLQKSETDLNQYSSEHMVVNNQTINKDASYSLSVLANPFTQVPDGWYTKMVYNPDAKINGFVYYINMSGKGVGKEKAVKEALEKALVGYKKDASSTEEYDVYKSSKQTVSIGTSNNGSIVVAMASNTYSSSQSQQMEPTNTSTTVGADTTSVYH